MEANKVKGEAKSLVLDNGAELTYFERGQKHDEVLICAAFYHHTFMPVAEGLAERYHVYGIVMRFDGISDQKEADGTTHWGRQWGKDVYDFAQKMGIKRFHYMGKCHGTIPGWWLVKNHPEVLIDFCSFFLAPHLKPQTAMMVIHDIDVCVKKMEEMAALGPGGASHPAIFKYGSEPQQAWDSLEECERDLKNITVPIGYLFGSEDPLLQDYFDSNMYAWKITKGCHFTILNGERHLMELDCPERVVDEAFAFIDQAHKGY